MKGFSGPGVGGLHFVEGRAETDDTAVIAYARRHGYSVEDAPRRRAPGKPPEPKE
ncbi:hypothetical protein [Streptomyces sp. NPDC047046]|uniref:hypothetical protein n=1 Tax=Streptomyces sp. NPDC047046 TaxID=3155378 RepID=UPI0033E9E470